ncbi:MAG: CoA-binding protein [Chlorobi bacterium]|nr:CoA-binding protein [Chlorobiota bacterium]
MVNRQLIDPKSIVVVGGSDDIRKPGGKILKNIVDNGYKGSLYVVNPKADNVQGIKTYKTVDELPDGVELAVLAIAAKYCPEAVEVLARKKNTKAFIIISAGFGEESPEGAEYERRIVEIVNSVNGSLIGPNCIGVVTVNHSSVFTTPVPPLEPEGADFISGSGATAVFIVEAGMKKGLRFNSIFSVGNSAQLGVEDVLEYMDESFDPVKSSKVKLLYIESVRKPQKLLKHASSLIKKGCRIAAVKAGRTEAGGRAASSHTGALAGSDTAVDALFRKAGIVRCYGREELANVAAVFMTKELKGKNIAIVTHAGGPAVMLTDTLTEGGLKVPEIKGEKADNLLEKLYPGSSVTNPIDFLATGTAEQLGYIIDACDNDFDDIDGIAVIFGSPGLFSVKDAYEVLHEKIRTSKKPVYPVMPSVINAGEEMEYFIGKGNVCFTDEVQLGNALVSVVNTPAPADINSGLKDVDAARIRSVIEKSSDGYLNPDDVNELLDAAGIPVVKTKVFTDIIGMTDWAADAGYPVVMKVVGPVHKSDVGGVSLGINTDEMLISEFYRMMKIEGAEGVLLQPMLKGRELFLGAKYEPGFGHIVLCGLGGIFVEVMKDVTSALAPVSESEALDMIKRLKGYKLFEGVRGEKGIDETSYASVIVRLSELLRNAEEIKELDINPLLAEQDKIVAVDARIRVEK